MCYVDMFAGHLFLNKQFARFFLTKYIWSDEVTCSLVGVWVIGPLYFELPHDKVAMLQYSSTFWLGEISFPRPVEEGSCWSR